MGKETYIVVTCIMTSFRFILEDNVSLQLMKLDFYIVNLTDGVCALREWILQCANDVREEQQWEKLSTNKPSEFEEVHIKTI